jgi:tetratricopeptide (TPR) repeat protein
MQSMSDYYSAIQLRLDQWSALRELTAGLDNHGMHATQEKSRAAIAELLQSLALIEPYWAFPGMAAFEQIQRAFQSGSNDRLAFACNAISRALASGAYRRRAIELDAAYWPALNGVGVNALNAWIKAGKPADDPRRDEARAMLQRSMKANPDQPKVASLLLKYQL